ncbi:MAG TPA: phosphoribosyl-ATP diphosphatase [Brevefilum sp.]
MFDELFQIIEDRKQDKPTGSYTARLMDAGENLILRKIGEETLEVIFAAKDEGQQRLVEESADLIYHLWVLLSYKGVSLEQVKNELASRHKRDQ